MPYGRGGPQDRGRDGGEGVGSPTDHDRHGVDRQGDDDVDVRKDFGAENGRQCHEEGERGNREQDAAETQEDRACGPITAGEPAEWNRCKESDEDRRGTESHMVERESEDQITVLP